MPPVRHLSGFGQIARQAIIPATRPANRGAYTHQIITIRAAGARQADVTDP